MASRRAARWLISRSLKCVGRAAAGAGSADAAVSETYAWGERKRQFSPEQVRLAYDVLQDKGWLASRPLAA